MNEQELRSEFFAKTGRVATSEPVEYQAFLWGFTTAAASRDAEVVSLTNQRDYEYVRAENAEQERDQLREQVKMLRDFIASAQVSSGVCCCGEAMDGHSSPMSCGHSPVDMWDYHSGELLEAYPDDLSALRAHDEKLRAVFQAGAASRDAEIAELVGVLGDVTAHLVAAHSLLSRGGKKAAASDTIFKIMLQDYEKSFEAGRKALAKVRKQT